MSLSNIYGDFFFSHLRWKEAIALITVLFFLCSSTYSQTPSEKSIRSVEYAVQMKEFLESQVSIRKSEIELNENFIVKLESKLKERQEAEKDASDIALSLFYAKSRLESDRHRLWKSEALLLLGPQVANENNKKEKISVFLDSLQTQEKKFTEKLELLVKSYDKLIHNDHIRAQFEKVTGQLKKEQ